jgi:hypothetical protein
MLDQRGPFGSGKSFAFNGLLLLGAFLREGILPAIGAAESVISAQSAG